MKIEIEITSPDVATITIDGKQATVSKSPGGHSMQRLTPESSLGAMIGSLLFGKVSEIMRAREVVAEHLGTFDGTWKRLPARIVDEIESSIF